MTLKEIWKSGKRFFTQSIDGASEYNKLQFSKLTKKWERINGNRQYTDDHGNTVTIVDNPGDAIVPADDEWYWKNPPQTNQLVREVLNQGKLYVGRMEDCAQFTKGLHFHLGHSDHPSVDGVVRVKYTISDGPNETETWVQVMRLADWATKAIKDGHDVLVTCDMGASRSRTFTAMLLNLLDGTPFDANLRINIRNKYYDEKPYKGFPPNYSLWREAAVVLEVMRGEAPSTKLPERETPIEWDAIIPAQWGHKDEDNPLLTEGCDQ